jgi:hypothetical protein
MNSPTATDSRVARESGASVTPASWDPYEVWLTRVKLPRELVQRRQVPHVAVAPAGKPRTGNGSSPEPSLA